MSVEWLEVGSPIIGIDLGSPEGSSTVIAILGPDGTWYPIGADVRIVAGDFQPRRALEPAAPALAPPARFLPPYRPR